MDKDYYIMTKIDELFLNSALLKYSFKELQALVRELYDTDSIAELLKHYLNNEINIAYLIYFNESSIKLKELIEVLYFNCDSNITRKSLKESLEKILSLEIYEQKDGLSKLLENRILPQREIDEYEFLKNCYIKDYLVALLLNGFEIKGLSSRLNSKNLSTYEKIMSLVYYLKTIFFVDSVKDADIFVKQLLFIEDKTIKGSLEFILSTYAKSRILNNYDKDFTPFLTLTDINSISIKREENILSIKHRRIF